MANLHEDELFPNSIRVDPTLVSRTCGTRLHVRVSRHVDAAVRAREEFHKKWQEIGGQAFYGISAGDDFDGNALAFPDCLPDRFRDIMPYTELYFAVDDIFIYQGPDEIRRINDAISQMLPGDSTNSGYSTQWTTTRRQMLAEISVNMIERDRDRAYLFLRATQRFAKFHQVQKEDSSMSWDEWCHQRWEDGDNCAYLAAIVYCVGLNLTQEELDKLLPITWPGMMCTILTNDYYSFDAEVHTELQDGILMNAVWRLMKTQDLTVAEAKTILLEDKMKGFETQFIEAKELYLASHPDMPHDVRRYLEYVELMIAGNWFWSAICPRYHEWKDFGRSGRRMKVQNDPDAYDETTAKCDTFIELEPSRPVDRPQTGKADADSIVSCFGGTNTDLNLETIVAPIEYLRSMPSKGVRSTMISALDVWCNAPPSVLVRVEAITSSLHDASLMLDDIEDGSPLRRGLPSTHSAFGVSQTINSANFLYSVALSQLIDMPNPNSIHVFAAELQNIYLGQALDLKWTHSRHCPTIVEYKAMVQNKTGALFRLMAGILSSEGRSMSVSKIDLMDLMTMVGEFFQIRDDYNNLCSSEYHSQKGFCEDLDEAKFSLPLIHLLQHTKRKQLFESLFRGQAYRGETMTLPMKQLVIKEMEQVGSLEFTKAHLERVQTKMMHQIELLEQHSGTKNYIFRLILDMLRVDDN